MEDKKFIQNKNVCKHNVIMEDRNKVIITGVIDIHSFDDELVLTEVEEGILTVKGISLKMNKLNLDNNELVIEGRIVSLQYSDTQAMKKASGGMFNKLFK